MKNYTEAKYSELFAKRPPKAIMNRTIKYMDKYNMSLNDAFEDAVKELAKKGTPLYEAWYHNDFREYIPSAYSPKYLDFTKYPLAYNPQTTFDEVRT